jgi:hypothetical protein
MQMDKKEAGPVYGLAANGTETQKRSSQMKITPVNEPRGEGNGWEPCAEDKATSFELDNGKEIVGLFDTRKDAEFAADAEGVWSVLSRLDSMRFGRLVRVLGAARRPKRGGLVEPCPLLPCC